MKAGSRLRLAGALVLFAVAAFAGGQAEAASPTPAWRIESLSLPTNFVPEDEAHGYFYEIRAVDITGAPLASGLVTLSDTLPKGLGVKSISLKLASAAEGVTIEGSSLCETTTVSEVSTVTCKVPSKVSGQSIAREALTLQIRVTTPSSAEGELVNSAQIHGAGAISASTTSKNSASPEVAASGLARFETELISPDGTPAVQAGSHPYLFTSSFELNTEISPEGAAIPARGDLRSVKVTLPPGLIGDPTASTYCTPREFNELLVAEGTLVINACPKGSVVGTIDALAENSTRLSGPVYNLEPPLGMPAQLGFQVAGFSFYIDTELGPGPNHPIVARLNNLTEIERPIAGRVTLWGTPADPSHDRLRGSECFAITGVSLGSCPAGMPLRPFLRLPTSCESDLPFEMAFDTWDNPNNLLLANSTLTAPEGCAVLTYNPTISVRPNSTVADSPSGLVVDLHVPQGDDPEQLATPDLRDAKITLPQGVSVNPASAAGLAACSPQEIDLDSNEGPACPSASKLGTVEVDTPLLDHVAKGSVYLASQGENPFGSLLAIYVVVDDPISGVVLKLAGKVEPDPVTGQLRTTFEENPQVPFEDLRVEFFDGPRGALRTPASCGTYTATADLRPWSSSQSGPNATPQSSFAISSGPAGPCPSGALEPHLEAGLESPIAGSFSPFTLRLRRDDGTQELAALTTTAPKGLSAKLKGIPYCPESAIAQAAARNRPEEGQLEINSPSCPAASEVGTAIAGAGAGPSPIYVSGPVYLAGPYKGAPLSLVAVIPAVTGPFDLGAVVNRVALRVDPQTAQVRAESDPFPSILSGIPVDVRDVQVRLNRPEFTLAPTNCEPKTFQAEVAGVNGGTSSVTDRLQVGACKALSFSPKLSLRLKGGTKRTAHPALRATLEVPPGEANIARTEVILPPAHFIDQNHINNPCTRVQFAAGSCPKSSVLGRARAFTPLLDAPLEGAIYFRSNGGERELPDIVADLNGQIHVILVGFVDSVHKKGSEVSRIRTTFAEVPDAPVSKAVLNFAGGKRGLLVNSRNLCKSNNRAIVRMNGQNGRLYDLHPRVKSKCRKH